MSESGGRRETRAASLPSVAASFGREVEAAGREFPASTWPPREDRKEEDGARVSWPRGGDDGMDDPRLPAFLSWLGEWRFVRDSTTSAQAIEYALDGAYSMNDGPWRTAHIIYAYVVGTAVILLCDGIKFSFGLRLSRALIAVPTCFALGWLLNHIPVTAWLIPDSWDVTTWWQPDPTATVEVPVEAPMGEG